MIISNVLLVSFNGDKPLKKFEFILKTARGLNSFVFRLFKFSLRKQVWF